MKFGKIVKTFKSKKGNEVVLRYPTAADLDDMLAFVNGLIDEDTFVLLSGKHISRKEEQVYLDETLEQMKKGEKIQIVAEVSGIFAGNCEIRRQIRRKGHVGSIGISLSKAYRSEGIGSEMVRALIEEGKKIGLRLATLTCMENNAVALHVYEKLGFKKAGTVPGSIEYKGKDVGEVVMYVQIL